jgi:hypothetical protein
LFLSMPVCTVELTIWGVKVHPVLSSRCELYDLVL